MATIIGLPKVDLTVTLQMNEAEARALLSLSNFRHDSELADALGVCYRDHHGPALLSLLDSVNSILGQVIARADSLREPLKEILPSVRERERPDFS